MVKQSLSKSLCFQVLVAIPVGITLGHFHPETGSAMKPLGDGFIKLIIAPIIFCTIVVGIAAMENMKKVGKTGGYAALYFEIVSTFALVIGLLVVNIWKPGVGMKVDVATLDTKSVNMLLVMMLTSKGAADIAAEGFIVIDLAATLASGGAVSVAALALILGIDPFMA